MNGPGALSAGRLTVPLPIFARDRGMAAILLPWGFISLVLVLSLAPLLGGMHMQDPDDYMRLLQLDAWLGGQSWSDVDNHRMGGAEGFSMHWSRLVDLPLAAATLIAEPFGSHLAALRFAAIVVPLLQLLAVMILMRGILRCLEFKDAAANLGTLIVPLLPLPIAIFSPLRVDHHGWQAVLALGMLRLLVDRRLPDRNALWAGAIAGLFVTISIEGLPVIAFGGGFFALTYLLDSRARGLANFLLGLAVTALGLFAVTCPPARWVLAFPDQVTWPHLATFALAAVLAQVLLVRGSKAPVPLRAALLALVGGIALAPLAFALGLHGFAPFSALDPLLRTYWLDQIAEVQTIFELPVDTVLMEISMMGLYGLAVFLHAGRMRRSGNPEGWLAVCLGAGLLCLLSLTMFRAALIAQILLVPLCALLLRDALGRASRLGSAVLRVPAILAALVLLTPAGGSLAGAAVRHAEGVTMQGTSDLTASECDISRLRNLPPGHVFATLDLGPEILFRTGHTVEASGYHRNQAAMLRVVRGFTAPPREAELIVRSTGAAYVVACKPAGDFLVFGRARPNSLAAELAADRPPAWLIKEPLAFSGSLVAYRVAPPAT
ncbi:MAG: hypothetical protein QM676_02920 [Novosphingobium sp.]